MAEKEGFAKFGDDNNAFIPRNSGGTAMAIDPSDPIIEDFTGGTGNESPRSDTAATSSVGAVPGGRSITPQPPQSNSSSTLPLFSAADNRLDRRKQNRNIAQSKTKDFEAELVCPRVNCAEKLVICLDLSQEMEKVSFRSRSGDKFAPLKLMKRALGIFLQSKHRLDRRHEFALVVLHDEAYWTQGFLDDPEAILAFLDGLSETYPSETFDLGSIFDVINKEVVMPKVEDARTIPPPYIVRVILIYGRSYCIPKFESRESQKLLQACPHFFLDAYYIHEPPTEENQCEEIFDVICDLDNKGLSYVFEVSRNPTKLYDCMSQLLAHPLQRPLQKDSSYNIEPMPVEAS